MANLVQSAYNAVTGATTNAITLTGVGAGHTIIAYGGMVAAGRTISVADNVNAGNYNPDILRNSGASTVGIFSQFGVGAGSTTVTLTQTGAAANMYLIAEEWNGLLSPVDKTNSNTVASTTTASVTSPTLTAPSEVALATCQTGIAGVTSLAPAAPFSGDPNNPASGALAAANFFTSGTGAVTSTFNWVTSTGANILIATYQVALGVDTLLGQGWV